MEQVCFLHYVASKQSSSWINDKYFIISLQLLHWSRGFGVLGFWGLGEKGSSYSKDSKKFVHLWKVWQGIARLRLYIPRGPFLIKFLAQLVERKIITQQPRFNPCLGQGNLTSKEKFNFFRLNTSKIFNLKAFKCYPSSPSNK